MAFNLPDELTSQQVERYYDYGCGRWEYPPTIAIMVTSLRTGASAKLFYPRDDAGQADDLVLITGGKRIIMQPRL